MHCTSKLSIVRVSGGLDLLQPNVSLSARVVQILIPNVLDATLLVCLVPPRYPDRSRSGWPSAGR
jgi:hypothetical protein